MVKMRVNERLETNLEEYKDLIGMTFEFEYKYDLYETVYKNKVFRFFKEELDPVEDIDDSNKIESLDKSASHTEEPSTESRPEQGIKLITEPRWEGKEVHIESPYDVVNKPIHYHFSEFEPIKVIQAWDLSFALGNVVKYIARAGRKDSSKLIEDLEKAKKYLEFEIEHLRNK